MILLWGILQDRPLALVRAALARRGAAVFMLDQKDAARAQIQLRVDADVAGAIQVGDERCDLAAVSAVYVRNHDSSTLDFAPDTGDAEAARRHVAAVDDVVTAWLDVAPAFVVNPFSAMASNSSKPYQLSLIRAAGFATPDTLLTTDAAAVAQFRERHGELIYKSISGVRSIVSRFTAEHAERLADLRWCPTQFQQYIPGRDHRVHTVGDDIFACEIVSAADDYRYGARQGMDVELRACELPPDCAARCLALARSLGLPVAGIDLRRTPDGEWFCFEANPSPAFSYYESATGQPIADAIAALLVSGAAGKAASGPPARRSHAR
jgi:glutathione synthase/RimK-type ligase-like ATP-grasp enzyme